jgi:hypothetical protein
LLDVFEDDHENCPLCHPSNHSPQQLHHGRTEAFLSECPLDLVMSSQGQLWRLPNGDFWAVLSSTVHPEALGEVAEGPCDDRRDEPDRGTKDLLEHFLKSALLRCLVQDRNAPEQFSARTESKKSTALINGVKLTNYDDGGICTLVYREGAWWTANPYLALSQAKHAFQGIHFDEDGCGEPIVSDETLAQYLGEAVITWKANPDHVQDE